MFKDFPSFHPLVVHFPIVLILLSVAFQAVILWKPQWQQIRWATLIIMGGAFLSALAASTLFHAMIAPDAPKEAMAVFEEHEKYAQYTLWMSGITFLVKGIGDFYKLFRRSYQLIILVAAIVTATFLSITGHHGARLTHIAGVGPMGKYLMKDNGDGHGEKEMEGIDMHRDSTGHLSDSMPGMKNMPGMDTMENMPGMKDMKDMKSMKGTKDMKNMKGMDTKKSMKDMKDMKNMPGMDTMKNMKDMSGMDTMKNMKGMDNMKNMPGMDMKNNPMDTFRFKDNNPARRKSTEKKQ